MNRHPARAITPEQEELERKQTELERAEAELVQAELELTTLRTKLAAFHRRYVQTVVTRYSELDAIEAEIARLLADHSPDDPEAQRRADEAQAKATDSAQATDEVDQDEPVEPFTPGEDLKKLYREVAKRVHPDLAADEAEQERRVRVMAEVNEAYAAGDEYRLQSLLNEWRNSPDAVRGNDAAAELVRVIRKLKLVRNRIGEVRREISELQEGDLFQLMQKAQRAEREGRDLLKDLAAAIEGSITYARRRLAELQHQGG